MILYMDKESALNLSNDDIKKLIDKAAKNKYDKLKNYYIGEHSIVRYEKKDVTAPNNKLISNMAKYITDTSIGYFLGKPIVYSSDNHLFVKKLQEVFDYNDEQDENIELAKAASIYGHIFEMIYLDEVANLRLVRINPKNIIMLYERESISPVACIRIIKTYDKAGNVIIKAEYWTEDAVTYLTLNNSNLIVTEKEEHYFKTVPFIEFINNEERLGDYEQVLSLIDAYNKANSNTANLYQYNDEAILKILKLGDVSSENIRQMKEDGAIILDDGGDIAWLIKDVPYEGLEAHKTRIKNDIHNLSGVPDMSDEKFGGNLSGVAMGYKMWHLEQLCAIKERKFKKALQRRIMIINNILNTKGAAYDYTDINIEFRRNKPTNLLETAQIVNMLGTELSKETRLKLLPFIDDIKGEIKRMAEEDKADFVRFEDTKDFIDRLNIQERINNNE